MGYLYLSIAILFEVVATTALKSSAGFTRPLPTAIVGIGYGIAFYCLSQALQEIPVGVAYAVWSGVGIILISLLSWYVHQQSLDTPAIVGIALIGAGVAVINLWSNVAPH